MCEGGRHTRLKRSSSKRKSHIKQVFLSPAAGIPQVEVHLTFPFSWLSVYKCVHALTERACRSVCVSAPYCSLDSNKVHPKVPVSLWLHLCFTPMYLLKNANFWWLLCTLSDGLEIKNWKRKTSRCQASPPQVQVTHPLLSCFPFSLAFLLFPLWEVMQYCHFRHDLPLLSPSPSSLSCGCRRCSPHFHTQTRFSTSKFWMISATLSRRGCFCVLRSLWLGRQEM